MSFYSQSIPNYWYSAHRFQLNNSMMRQNWLECSKKYIWSEAKSGKMIESRLFLMNTGSAISGCFASNIELSFCSKQFLFVCIHVFFTKIRKLQINSSQSRWNEITKMWATIYSAATGTKKNLASNNLNLFKHLLQVVNLSVAHGFVVAKSIIFHLFRSSILVFVQMVPRDTYCGLWNEMHPLRNVDVEKLL